MSGSPQDLQAWFGVRKCGGRGLLQAALAHLTGVEKGVLGGHLWAGGIPRPRV